MKKFLKFGWNLLQVLIIIYVVIVSTFILFKNKFGYTQIGSYTFFNLSSIDVLNNKGKKGNLLVIKLETIKEGDLTYYYAVSDDKYILKSSVVKSIEKDNNEYIFNFTDGTNVSSSRIAGLEICNFSLLGDILTIVESKYGFLLLVLLPIFIVFLYQIYIFISYISEEETA